MRNALAVLALAAAGCSSVSVTTDWDRSVDLAALHKFDWMPEPADGTDPFRGNTLVKNRIMSALQAELASKSVSKTTGSPDFLVAIHGYSRDRLEVYDMGPGWRMGGVSVNQYTEGTLIVDFVRPGSKDLLWRGVATSVLDSSSGSPERVDEAVHKLLEGYPPLPSAK